MTANLADDIFKCVSMYDKIYILIKTSRKFVPKGPIDNYPALVYVMAWRRIGDKPLSKPVLTRYTDAYAALGGDELNGSASDSLPWSNAFALNETLKMYLRLFKGPYYARQSWHESFDPLCVNSLKAYATCLHF